MASTTDFEKRMDQRFDDLTALMSEFSNTVQTRFDGVDHRLDGVEQRLDGVDHRLDRVEIHMVNVDSRLDGIENRLDKLEVSHQRLLNTIDGFVRRIDDYETELVARDHKIERLERWIEQIAQKTGIKLT